MAIDKSSNEISENSKQNPPTPLTTEEVVYCCRVLKALRDDVEDSRLAFRSLIEETDNLKNPPADEIYCVPPGDGEGSLKEQWINPKQKEPEDTDYYEALELLSEHDDPITGTELEKEHRTDVEDLNDTLSKLRRNTGLIERYPADRGNCQYKYQLNTHGKGVIERIREQSSDSQ